MNWDVENPMEHSPIRSFFVETHGVPPAEPPAEIGPMGIPNSAEFFLTKDKYALKRHQNLQSLETCEPQLHSFLRCTPKHYLYVRL